ncbi:MAG: Gfo/Idh/MocA family oxidoreductase [Balneolales bacterium]
MIIIDKALKERERQRNPLKIGIIGAGYMGRGTVLTIESSVPGMEVAAIYNRSIARAEFAYTQAGISVFEKPENAEQLDDIVRKGNHAVTDNPHHLCQSKELDVIIEATGEIEFGAKVVLEAIKNKNHVVMMNAELDATIGPILKVYADRNDVILTNADGDQPGVIMNLYRFVDMIGYQPLLAGNIKGLQDPYRNPDTQKAFAEQHRQKPRMVTSFADGTKISMEMAVVANATGFGVGQRGMYGPKCSHVNEALRLFPLDKIKNGGMVDYILGAEPGPGVFVLAYNDHPIKQQYMNYFKMGDGPLYLFYVPYHLPHLEVPITAARAALFSDATTEPISGPVCHVITVAKRDLKAGETLDGIGGFTCYGVIDNAHITEVDNLFPMGLSDGCILNKDIKKDEPLTFDDVSIPSNRLCDQLYKEQRQHFLMEGVSKN